MIRAADYVIDALSQFGVKHVFTVTGGGSIFLCDALAHNEKITTVFCHHEQATAIAAEGYARTTKHLGVSLVTSGPGGTNAITGVAGSWTDSVPHLVISGQSFVSQTIGDSGLRQLGVQEINIVDLVRPITKYAVMVTSPDDLRYHLEKALFLAFDGRPGPVWLDIPGDVQNAKVDPEKLRGFSPPENKRKDSGVTKNLQREVALLVNQLENSQRPLFHVGQGVKIAGAEEKFLSLVEKYQIPFVTARNANDLTPSDHPLFMGRPGTFPQRGANFCVQLSDCYVAIGTRLSLPQTGYNSKDFARNAFRCMVDIDTAELNKKTLDLHLKIHSDASDFLDELARQLEGKSVGTTSWKNRCYELNRKYPPVTEKQRQQEKYVNSYYFTEVLSELLSKDAIVVTDMGVAFQGTHQAFKVKKGQTFFTNSGFASMGWGLPAAIGASMSDLNRKVVCVSGDGGVMMNIQELATIAEYRLPVKLFIYNNGGYLTIKQTQEIGFGGKLFGVGHGSGLSFPDFVKLAESFGLPVRRIESNLGIKEALLPILNSHEPCVCELMMDPNQEQSPRTMNRRRPDGTLSPSRLEDLYPFLDESEIEENLQIPTLLNGDKK